MNDERHPPGGEPEIERLRREVEHWQACHRLLTEHIARTAVARAKDEDDRELLLRVAAALRAAVARAHRQENHLELLLRAADALRAVVHSSVGSRELLDLAEQLEHAMGDPEPRG